MSENDHDHAGDHLGEAEPVESIDVTSVTIGDFEVPNTYLVFQGHDDTWYGLRTETQDVEFADADGARVINDALRRLGEGTATGGRRGSVRVISNTVAEPTTLESTTAIEHVTDGTGLILEPGVQFLYRGDEQAVAIGGDSLTFESNYVESNGQYVIRDLGMSDSTVLAGTLRGGSDAVWFGDAENQLHAPPADAGRTHVHVAWGIPEGDYALRMTSAAGASFTDYRFVSPIFFGADEAGFVLGDESDAQSVNHNMFYVDVDGRNGPRFIVNDSHNVVYLKDYVPGGLTSPDVLLRPSAEDTTVLPDCVRGWPAGMITEREAYAATDLSKFDPFRPEVLSYDLFPDSLSAYETIERDGGTVDLYSGYVEQRTGDEPGSWANLRRHVSQNYGRVKFFDTWAVLQTNVWVSDNQEQEAWLVWGDRQGPGVGWRIVDDVLEGFVHDGDDVFTRTLRSGFDPGSSWNLVAFYNYEDGVRYWVQDAETAHLDSEAPNPAQPYVEATFDTGAPIPAGALSFSRPADDHPATAYRIATIDLTTTEPAEKAIRWSNWRNHQYPLF